MTPYNGISCFNFLMIVYPLYSNIKHIQIAVLTCVIKNRKPDRQHWCKLNLFNYQRDQQYSFRAKFLAPKCHQLGSLEWMTVSRLRMLIQNSEALLLTSSLYVHTEQSNMSPNLSYLWILSYMGEMQHMSLRLGAQCDQTHLSQTNLSFHTLSFPRWTMLCPSTLLNSELKSQNKYNSDISQNYLLGH